MKGGTWLMCVHQRCRSVGDDVGGVLGCAFWGPAYIIELHQQHSISSLKRLKNEVQQVGKGTECGVLFDDFTAFQPGDVLECVGTEAVSASSKDILEAAPGQQKE